MLKRRVVVKQNSRLVQRKNKDSESRSDVAVLAMKHAATIGDLVGST